MAIEQSYKKNFETLQHAAENGDLCIAECADRDTGKRVIAICATYVPNHPAGTPLDNAEQIHLVPLAKMFDGNPYEELSSPLDSLDDPRVSVLAVEGEDGSSSGETPKGGGVQMEFSEGDLKVLLRSLKTALRSQRETLFGSTGTDSESWQREEIADLESLLEEVSSSAFGESTSSD